MNLRKVIGFAFGPISVAALSLLTVPLTAWYFKTEDIGKISMLQIGISFCLLVFSLGLDQAYVREYHDTRNKTGLFKACILPGFTLLLIFLSALLLLEPTALSVWLFDVENVCFSTLIAVCILSTFLGRFFSLILRMQERGWEFSLSQFLPKLAFLAILCIFIYRNNQLGMAQLLISHTLGFISAVVLIAWSSNDVWHGQCESVTTKTQKELFKFGLPLVISGAAFWGMTSLDKLFLKYYSNFDELGLYTIVNSFAGIAVILQNIFTTVWAPAAYKMHSEGGGDKEFQKIVDGILLIIVMIISLIGMFSWVLIYLLPAKYHAGQYIIMGCLLYPSLYSLSETTGIGLGISRKSKWSMLAVLVSLASNILFNLWLVPKFGAKGAAIATGMAFLLLLILRTEFSRVLGFKFSTVRLYFIVLIFSSYCVIFCLYGDRLGFFGVFGWFLMFSLSAYIGFILNNRKLFI